MNLDRRGFLVGALCAPVVAKLATVEGMLTIPAAPLPGVVTYADISARTAMYAAGEMLRHARPTLILHRMAAVATPLLPFDGTVVTFRRPPPFAS